MENNNSSSAYILSAGYGIVSMYPLEDPFLSLPSRSLYACLGSFKSTQGLVVFPSRNQLCSELKISKDTLKKARNELVAAGLISVAKHENNGKYANNTYAFIAYPDRYVNIDSTSPYWKWRQPIIDNTIWGAKGCSYRLIWKIDTLDHIAKQLCVYLDGHALNMCDDPYVEMDPAIIREHFGIETEKTLNKYLKQLEDHNFLRRCKVKSSKGTWTNKVRYSINRNGPYGLGLGQSSSTVIPFQSNQIDPDGKDKDTVATPDGKSKDTIAAPGGKSKDTVAAPGGKDKDTVAAPDGKDKDTVAALDSKDKDTVTTPAGKIADTVIFPDGKNPDRTTKDTNSLDVLEKRYIDNICKNINFKGLVDTYGKSYIGEKLLDGLIGGIIEVTQCAKPFILINCKAVSILKVKKTLSYANETSVRRVLERIRISIEYKEDEEEIRNMQHYIIASLYCEIESYFEQDAAYAAK